MNVVLYLKTGATPLDVDWSHIDADAPSASPSYQKPASPTKGEHARVGIVCLTAVVHVMYTRLCVCVQYESYS